ncbi:MAG: MetQ/NlpA family ABC transporter substrate-binding protein [Eggerthellaceae bacterium]|jgi:D-methionine transport system substrate-binding protein|nr:MetQ/NlpA family ABC transporter substrate-binding protein [Eggerthellaceae bacterium]
MESTTLKRRFRYVVAGAAVAALAAFALTGCGSNQQASSSSSSSASGDDKTITVAASPTPHADILNGTVKDQLAADGYTLVVKEFTDYVQPNTVTEEGDVDANYFQHQPYLDNFNQEQGTHLASVAKVHFEPMGIYPGKTKSLDSLADGATVAVPNDATNEARALLLLQQAGLIEVKDPTDVNTTINDITSNPKNLQFKEVEAATVPTILRDVDIACINGNYAKSANLNVNSDSLAVESADSTAAQTYANILVVKEGNENSDKTKELVKALNSDTTRDYINNTFEGAVVPVF